MKIRYRAVAAASAVAITAAMGLTLAGPAGASPAPDVTYDEYQISDGAGLVLNGPGACGLGPAYDCVLESGESEDSYFEFRNPYTYKGMDVYELYDPVYNNCINWDPSDNRFGKGDCDSGDGDEEFWYNFGSGNTASTEMYNVGATEYFGSDYCLSALGTDDDSGLAAYKCSDNNEHNQYWQRRFVGST